MKRYYVSIIMKSILVVAVLIGFLLSYFTGALKGTASLLYFTIQSNIWIGVFDMVMIGFMIHKLIHPQYEISHILYKIQQVFTICITITGIIFCFVLVPGYFADKSNGPDGFEPFNFGSIMLHMLVPLIAIADYFLTVRKVNFKYYDCVWVIIPMVFYLGLTTFGYVYHWDYGGGLNYPYFFLNYDNPSGIFGFGGETPYFMGSFYWIVLILLLTIGLSLLYIKIIRVIDMRNIKRDLANTPISM